MKRGLKKIVVLAMAEVMTIAPVMTASAETEVSMVSGGTYQIPFGTFEKSELHDVIVSDVPLGWGNEAYFQNYVAENSKAGYEIRQAYFYYPIPSLRGLEGYVENGSEWVDIYHSYDDPSASDTDGITDVYSFTVTINGQAYSECAHYYGHGTDASGREYDFSAMRLPVGYVGNAYINLWSDNEKYYDLKTEFRYYLRHAQDIQIPQTTTSFASSWKQDAKGWWVERSDGSHLVNEWYQSPTSGLWYYMGADGYMLMNTTTPDGYKVNADGVWVQ